MCTDAPPAVTNGSKTRPYLTIQRALAAATELGSALGIAPTIAVAARGSSQAYAGPVDVQDGGLTLNGGYTPTFDARDASANPTVIATGDVTMSLVDITKPITVDGFVLTSTGTGALVVTRSTDAVHVSHCTLTASVAFGNSHTTLSITGSLAPGPRLDHLTVRTGDLPRTNATTSTAIGVDASAAQLDFIDAQSGEAGHTHAMTVTGALPGDLVLRHALLRSGRGGQESLGLYVTSNFPSTGTVVVEDSQLFSSTPDATSGYQAAAAYVGSNTLVRFDRDLLAGASAMPAYGLVVNGGSVVLRNSVVLSGHGLSNSTSTAVALSSAASVTIAGSTLIAGDSVGGVQTEAALTAEASHPIVSDSVLATWSTDSSAVCYHEGPSSTGDPRSFQNNALARCTTPYHDNTHGTQTDLTTAGAVNALDGRDVEIGTCVAMANCEKSRFAGNLVLAPDLFALFTDPDGADNDFYMTADDDLSLKPTAPTGVTQGGKDTRGSDCGTVQTPASCGGTAVNYLNAPRTLPFSIGAY
jgi:hypothetical protein